MDVEDREDVFDCFIPTPAAVNALETSSRRSNAAANTLYEMMNSKEPKKGTQCACNVRETTFGFFFFFLFFNSYIESKRPHLLTQVIPFLLLHNSPLSPLSHSN